MNVCVCLQLQCAQNDTPYPYFPGQRRVLRNAGNSDGMGVFGFTPRSKMLKIRKYETKLATAECRRRELRHQISWRVIEHPPLDSRATQRIDIQIQCADMDPLFWKRLMRERELVRKKPRADARRACNFQ